MERVYVKKPRPRDRRTWFDRFIALEPAGGVRAVIERAQNVKR